MNDEEIRRIRRLVVPDPQLPPLPPPVDARQAERFHRALGGSRRAVSPHDPVASRETSMVSSPSPSSSPSKRKESAREDSRPAVDAHRPRPPVMAVMGVVARETEETREADAEQESALTATTVTAPPMPLPHVAWTPLPEGWERELADTVATLCRSSEPNFHSWTIQVPVDAETLPHTELRLTFSPHHLTLRFSTQSTRSLALISAHQSQLRALLVRALPGDRHIEIDIT